MWTIRLLQAMVTIAMLYRFLMSSILLRLLCLLTIQLWQMPKSWFI